MDLFERQVEEELLHPNFVSVSSDHLADVRAVLNEWADGFIDRDNNFSIEFQTKFNQQFWELYLHQVFKEAGFSPSFEHAAPDFELTVGGISIVVEATTTQAAKDTTPEWMRHVSDFRPGQNDLMMHYATIRFANAISAKLTKYRTSYAGLPHVSGKPFILGVGQYEQPLFFLCGHIPALRVLFGLDEPLYVWHGSEIVIVGAANRNVELKRFDAPIELGLFRDNRASEISGVLCSALATTGKCEAISKTVDPHQHFFAVRFTPTGESFLVTGAKGEYEESLVDGLHLFINPFADNPLDPQPFIDAGVAIHTISDDPDRYDFVAPRGTLSTRTTFKIKGVEQLREQIVYHDRPPLPAVVEWPEGELVQQETWSILCDREYLAHYRGWTILISRDRTDQDWYGQAVERLVTSVAGVIEANRFEVRDVGPVFSEPTKEFALRKTAELVDRALAGA